VTGRDGSVCAAVRTHQNTLNYCKLIFAVLLITTGSQDVAENTQTEGLVVLYVITWGGQLSVTVCDRGREGVKSAKKCVRN
jgi:hypothetical protein